MLSLLVSEARGRWSSCSGTASTLQLLASQRMALSDGQLSRSMPKRCVECPLTKDRSCPEASSGHPWVVLDECGILSGDLMLSCQTILVIFLQQPFSMFYHTSVVFVLYAARYWLLLSVCYVSRFINYELRRWIKGACILVSGCPLFPTCLDKIKPPCGCSNQRCRGFGTKTAVSFMWKLGGTLTTIAMFCV